MVWGSIFWAWYPELSTGMHVCIGMHVCMHMHCSLRLAVNVRNVIRCFQFIHLDFPAVMVCKVELGAQESFYSLHCFIRIVLKNHINRK